MATSKPASKTLAKKDVDEAINSLGPLAKVLNKTAGSLWGIFVRKYIAQGVALAACAVAVSGVSLWLLPYKSLFLLIPFSISAMLGYWAIQFLINPHYPAMGDVISKVQSATKPKPVEVVTGTTSSRTYTGGMYL